MQHILGTLGSLAVTQGFEQRVISLKRTVLVLNADFLKGKSKSRETHQEAFETGDDDSDQVVAVKVARSNKILATS